MAFRPSRDVCLGRFRRGDRSGNGRSRGGIEQADLRGLGPHDARQDRRLVSAAIVEAQVATQFFEALLGQVPEQLGKGDGNELVDEAGALASIGDFEVVLVDEDEQFVAGEEVQDLAGVRHERRGRYTRFGALGRWLCRGGETYGGTW